MIFLFVLLFSVALSLCLTPLVGKLGHWLNLVDRPGGRRQHRGIIPRTGGLALFAAFFLVVLFIFYLPSILPPFLAAWLPPRNDPYENQRLAALLGGSIFCTVAGFLDDRYEWRSGPQYLVQLIASLIAISGLIFIKHVNNPFGDTLLGGPDGLDWWIVFVLTIFWFMGMMVTVNWLDGLSGLSSGVTAILCVILTIHMLYRSQPPQLSVAVLPLALLGATLGFLPYNFSPAKIFMGSSGSYFLGFTVAALGIIGGARLATVMLVLGLPAIDVAWLIFRRWQRGLSPGQSGRDHLHFRLLDLGLSERTIVLGYWLFCIIFGSLTLLVNDRLYKLIALSGLGAIALGVLIWAGRSTNQIQADSPQLKAEKLIADS